jgi:hypothetical protein
MLSYKWRETSMAADQAPLIHNLSSISTMVPGKYDDRIKIPFV